MTRIIIALAIVLGGLYALKSYTANQRQKEVDCAKADSLYLVIDSLRTEAFIYMTNFDRYEIALGKLYEEDSVAAAKFEKALSNIE